MKRVTSIILITAFSLMISGNDGIGTNVPVTKLDVRGALNVGIDEAGHDVTFFASESGGRMFWDESKAALRAGLATGNQWDDANVGEYSTAIGKYVTAGPADNTIAIGTGIDYQNQLVNNKANSLMVGFGSTTPTLFVDGNSVGIGKTNPNAKLHVLCSNTAAAAIGTGKTKAADDLPGIGPI